MIQVFDSTVGNVLGRFMLLGLCMAPRTDTPVFAEETVVLNANQEGVQRGNIVLDSYSYVPGHLVVQSGKVVELTLSSVTTMTPHNFVLKEPEAGLDVNQDVGAGKSVTVRFTPTKAGTYTFYCDKKLLFFPSHREKGMEGRLEVR